MYVHIVSHLDFFFLCCNLSISQRVSFLLLLLLLSFSSFRLYFRYVVVFGGEVDPSAKGHEGAGGFTNELTAFRVVEGARIPGCRNPMYVGVIVNFNIV